MILPDELLPLYQRKAALYNQTASKAEQLALCQFLRDGHLDSQIRKLKRLYAGKAKALATELEQTFSDQAFGRIRYSGTSSYQKHAHQSTIQGKSRKKRHPRIRFSKRNEGVCPYCSILL